MQSHAATAAATSSVPLLRCVTYICRLNCIHLVGSNVWSSCLRCNECCILTQAALRKCCCGGCDVRRLAFRLTPCHLAVLASMPTCREFAAWHGTSRCSASGPSRYSACRLQLRCEQGRAAPGVASAVDAHGRASAGAVDAEQACNTPLGWRGLPL